MAFQLDGSSTVVKGCRALITLQFATYFFELNKIKKNTYVKTNAEATVALPLNQGTMKGTGCFVPFLNFLWLLSLFQDKESDKNMISEISNNDARFCWNSGDRTLYSASFN